MNNVETWGEAITVSLMGMSQKFLDFFPVLLGAIIVFAIGWIIAASLGKLVEKLVKTARVDRAAEKLGFGRRLAGVGVNSSISAFLGGLVKWFLILVFLMAATDILKLVEVTAFLNSIIAYIPNVIVAVVILAFVFILGNFVYDLVKGSSRAAGVMSATLLAAVSKWAIIIFGIFAALIQLGVASSLVSIIFTGFVAMVAIAGGLAFGLGGKEEAQLILKKLREEIVGNYEQEHKGKK